MTLTNKITVLIAVGALTLSAAGFARSATPLKSPVDYLKRSMKAMVAVNYHADESVTVKTGRRTQTEKSRVIHAKPNSTSWTYLSDRGQVERIVVDSNRSHWQYIPRTQQLIFSPSMTTEQDFWQETYLPRLLSNYDVKDNGIATLSGRKTRLLTIAPKKGHYGPSKMLWSDESTGIIVKSDLRSTDGDNDVSSVLSGLDFNKKVSPKDFTPPKARKQSLIREQALVLPLVSLAHQWKHDLLVPGALTKGYTLEGARLLRRQKRDFVHLRYSDGFNTVSLFEESAPALKSAGHSRDRVHGSSVSWETYTPFYSLSWRERGLKLTLICDLPRPEMLRLVKSVKLFNPH